MSVRSGCMQSTLDMLKINFHMDPLEQYTKRNNLRFFGMVEKQWWKHRQHNNNSSSRKTWHRPRLERHQAITYSWKEHEEWKTATSHHCAFFFLLDASSTMEKKFIQWIWFRNTGRSYKVQTDACEQRNKNVWIKQREDARRDDIHQIQGCCQEKADQLGVVLTELIVRIVQLYIGYCIFLLIFDNIWERQLACRSYSSNSKDNYY